ncbi:MAG: class I SAM-dependent methyltransferase [Dehalococcoidia bacterium]
MRVDCPVCSDDNTSLLGGHIPLRKCPRCTHTFTASEDQTETHDAEYYLKTHRNWFKHPNYGLFKFIYEQMLTLMGDHSLELLDVGCGQGDFVRFVSERNSTAKIYGIDLASNQHPGVHFIRGDFLEQDIESRFNVICSLAMIEHVADPRLFVQKASALLKPGGLLVAMTLNNDSLLYRIGRGLNHLGIKTAYNRLYSAHHLQHYTNRSLRVLMERHGYEILLQRNHGFPTKAIDVPEGHYLIEWMSRLAVWIIFMLAVPLKSGMLQTIVCRKRE